MSATGEFRPFVHVLGEHLDGYGNVCKCQEVKPSTMPSKAKVQIKRVMTWQDDEIREAKQRGVSVWVQSKGEI